jgi:osmoprotectant transport system substrate-binding protein
MSTKRWLSALAALLLSLSLALAACGDGDGDGGGGDGDAAGEQADAIVANPDNGDVAITIGSKNFTEQKILGEIFAQALSAAGYDISKQLNLGDEQTALRALRNGDIDAYPEYTGTALLSFFEVPSDELPSDPQEAYEQVRAGFEELGLTAFEPTPFTNSNEVATTQETADELGLETISDLDGQAGDLTLYGTPECRQRRDCLLGLQDVYGLQFAEFVPVAIDLRHAVLTRGEADLSIVFTTDPQIQREGFALLADDMGIFPPYNSTLVVRDEVVTEAGPDLERVVGQVEQGLTNEAMQELNARVDLDKQTPQQVASEYLSETGLVN